MTLYLGEYLKNSVKWLDKFKCRIFGHSYIFYSDLKVHCKRCYIYPNQKIV